MTTEQASFDFTSPPTAPVAELECLLAYLSAHPGFHTARTLAASLSLTDRQIRSLAEQSDGLIISAPKPAACSLAPSASAAAHTISSASTNKHPHDYIAPNPA